MRRKQAVTILLSLLALATGRPIAGAQEARTRRIFPDTKARIFVFNDQLPNQLTEDQLRFCAIHYVGSQKQSRTWTRKIRKLNPNYIMLHYQLAVGTGPALFLDGDNWTNDFAQVKTHTDWFVRDAQGRAIHQKDWNWDVMDIRFEGEKPHNGFPEYWTKSAIQRMRDAEADGCFADSYTQDILMGQVQPPFAWFQDVEACKREWLPNLNKYGAYCAAAFHKEPEKFYYLPNFGGMVTTWDKVTDYSLADGGMNEGFAAPGPGRHFSLDDWKLAMGRLLNLSAKDKILLCQTSINPADAGARWFVVGSYLLIKGHHTYLNMMAKGTLEWYPEYDLDLGAYKDEPSSDVNALWNARWNVYRRVYAKGMVLVNPSERAVTIINLGRQMRVLESVSGGEVGPQGLTAGKLNSHYVSGLTIPAYSARVLLY